MNLIFNINRIIGTMIRKNNGSHYAFNIEKLGHYYKGNFRYDRLTIFRMNNISDYIVFITRYLRIFI